MLAPPQPALKVLLQRAASYVRQFEQDFAAVISDETYDQQDVVHGINRPGAHRIRRIQSEMLFMRLPGEGLSWLSVRNVLSVDGESVTDSHDRIDRAINGDAGGLAARLRSIADEGARFNIGGIQRNFNDPILPLLFVDPQFAPHFKFKREGDEDVDGIHATKISYKENDRPTVIAEPNGKSVFSSGAIWLRPSDGVVVKTEMEASLAGLSFTIRVVYREDPKLEMWIPASMEEHYLSKTTREQVDCFASYSNARRFETSGRIVK